MTPEERTEAIVETLRKAIISGNPAAVLGTEAGVNLGIDEVVPAVYWPKRMLVEAFAAATAEERVRCATVVQRWKGPPTKTGMIRAITEPERAADADGRSGYDPTLARQAATVDLFAAEMKARLVENRAKGDWRGADVPYLLIRMLEEAGELVKAVRVALEGRPAGRWPDMAGAVAEVKAGIVREAADTGNLAMMVADALGVFGREEPA